MTMFTCEACVNDGVPELLHAREFCLDKRPAVEFVLLYDLTLEVLKAAGAVARRKVKTCTDCFIALIVRNKMPIPPHQVFHFGCYALGLVSVAHHLFGCSHHPVDALGRDRKPADQQKFFFSATSSLKVEMLLLPV